jgi:hypothetical protein
MKRLFWTALGAAAGAVAVRKAARTAQAYTPKGLAKSFAGVGHGLRELADDVRIAMAERESELRLALGVDEGGIEPRRAAALIGAPTSDLADAELADSESADSDRATNPARRARH